MSIVIAGGTGFLGTPLVRALVTDGHEVTVLSRRANASAQGGTRVQHWTPDGSAGAWARALAGADAVINLAGEPIAEGRWTSAKKARILESRILATRSIVEAIRQAEAPPRVLINASGVGYYGPLDDEVVTETRGAGADFLARVCVAWEDEARKAEGTTRVVLIRTGLVLERDGGALPRMLLPFRLGAGGPVGSGRQYWPWIHRDDWIAMVCWAIRENATNGPLNATAPHPVTNAAFAKALGRAMRRPAFMPAPAFALRLILGEMADALLLSGQRAVPAESERLGFTFAHRDLGEALGAIL